MAQQSETDVARMKQVWAKPIIAWFLFINIQYGLRKNNKLEFNS